MLLILFLYALAPCYAELQGVDWNQFKVLYKKQYNSTEEENLRKKIFYENMDVIRKNNVNFINGLSTFEMGINQYGDFTQREFEVRMLGMWGNSSRDLYSGEDDEEVANMEGHTKRNESSFFEELDRKSTEMYEKTLSAITILLQTAYVNVVERLSALLIKMDTGVQLNDTVDWVKLGAVTPAKDQGFCGSCWAFSAVGALEGQLYRKNGKLEPLSVQNLIDCTRGKDSYDNKGCSGGLMDASYQYVIDNGGIASERDYPYEQKDLDCRYENRMMAGTCRSYVEILGEEAIKYILAERGPLSVVMDASSIEFRFYKSGFYESRTCSSRVTNHAVVLVGFGKEPSGEEYWLIKNSWGGTWGADGTARVSMARDCGIHKYAIYPVV